MQGHRIAESLTLGCWMHVRVRPECAVQDLRKWGGGGRCTTACGNEAAQAGAKQKRSPRPLTGTHQARLLTCSLLRAGVLEGPCRLGAAGLSASSALSADSACRQAAAGLKHG